MVLLIMISCLHILVILNESNTPKSLDFIMGSVILIADILKTNCLFIESFIHNRKMHRILSRFQHIDYLLAEHRQSNYLLFRKAYGRKFILNIILFLPHSILYYIFTASRASNVWMSFTIKIWQTISLLAILRNVFYIDLLKHHMQQLNLCVQRIDISHASDRFLNRFHLMRRIHLAKSVHLQLWEISQDINESFGWGTVTMVLEIFIDATFCAHWSYAALFIYRSVRDSTRMAMDTMKR